MEKIAADGDVIALAGIYQAVGLVRSSARSGGFNRAALCASIGSVFRLDADDAEAVFGGLAGLRHGLTTLTEQLGKSRPGPDAELTGYAASLMFLERKLIRLPWMLDTLRQEIRMAAAIAEQAGFDDPAVMASLAHAYSQTISRLNPRILVHGDPERLNDADTANRIRALLLAGIRAAVLWRQTGGSRLKLLFRRKRIVESARISLKALEA